MTFCARDSRALAAVFVLAHAVAPARAAPFTSNDALKTAVDNCLSAVPSGLNCCSSGAADCGAAGSADMPDWDVSQVTDMSGLFWYRREFNQDISRWDVAQVTQFWVTFGGAYAFNQDITGWAVSPYAGSGNMFYRALAWNAAFVNCGYDNTDTASCVGTYSTVEEVYGPDDLSDSLHDDGPPSAWKPFRASSCDAPAPFPSHGSLFAAVARCLAAVPSGVDCCSTGGADCGPACGADMKDWDVSRVTSMYSLFGDRAEFNADIGGWDVGAVINMHQMFDGARDFNQDISGWDVSSVRNMRQMFSGGTGGSEVGESFNQDIGGWDVSSVEDMTNMFLNHHGFTADITGWNVKTNVQAGGMFGPSWEGAYHNCGYDGSHAACTGTYQSVNRDYDGPPNVWERVACWVPKGENGRHDVGDDPCGDYWGASIALGTTCQPTCDQGYSPSGPTVCGEDGALTTTTCHRNCDLTTPPVDGNVGDCVDVAHNTSCDPGCAGGFASSSSLTCSDGVLTPSVVLCLDTTGGPCDASEAPENGAVGTCTNALASGTICQPTCDLGFEASGFSYCDGGAYTAATCVAEATCDASTPPRNGGLGNCTNALASRTTCVPTCDPGFSLTGVTSCMRGTLVSARCAPPPPPPSPPPAPPPPSPPTQPGPIPSPLAPPPPPLLFADDDSDSGHATAAPFVAFAFAVVAMTFGDGRH